MKFFKKKYIRKPLVILVISSLLLQIMPSPDPAQAFDPLGWINKKLSKIDVPVLDYTSEGDIKLGNWCISGNSPGCSSGCAFKTNCRPVETTTIQITPGSIEGVVSRALSGCGKGHSIKAYDCATLNHTKDPWRIYWEKVAGVLVSPEWVQSVIQNTQGDMTYRHAVMMEVSVNGEQGLAINDGKGRAWTILADFKAQGKIGEVKGVSSLQWIRGIQTECGFFGCDMTDPDTAENGPRAWVEWRESQFRNDANSAELDFLDSVIDNESEEIVVTIENECDCINPFSKLSLSWKGHQNVYTQTDLLSDKNQTLFPRIDFPPQCELTIPLPEEQGLMTSEQKLAQRQACTYFTRLQRAVAQEIFLAKKIYNATDPFGECLFLRTCRTNCGFKLGELAFKITVLDIAALFLPGGALTVVQKVLNIGKMIKQIYTGYEMITKFLEDGVDFVNKILEVANYISGFFASFSELGLNWSDALIYGGGAATSYLTGNVVRELGVDAGGKIGWLVEKGGSVLEAGDGAFGGVATTMVFNQDRAKKGFNKLKELLTNFAQNLLTFSTAKSEALQLSHQLEQDMQAVRSAFKAEETMSFLFTEKCDSVSPNCGAGASACEKRECLDGIVEDLFSVTESISAFLGEVSEAGTLKDGTPVTVPQPGEGLEEWQALPPDGSAPLNASMWYCSQDDMDMPLGGTPVAGVPDCNCYGNNRTCVVPNRAWMRGSSLTGLRQGDNPLDPDITYWFHVFKDVYVQNQGLYALLDTARISQVIDEALSGCNKQKYEGSYDCAVLNYTKRPWAEYWEDLASAVVSPAWIKEYIKKSEEDCVDISDKGEREECFDGVWSARHTAMMDVVIYGNVVGGITPLGREIANRLNIDLSVIQGISALEELKKLDSEQDMTDEFTSSAGNTTPREWVAWRISEYKEARNLPQIASLLADNFDIIQTQTEELVRRKRALNLNYKDKYNNYWMDVCWCEAPFGELASYEVEGLRFNFSYDSDIAYQNWDDRISIIDKVQNNFEDLRTALDFGLVPEAPLMVFRFKEADRKLEELIEEAEKMNGDDGDDECYDTCNNDCSEDNDAVCDFGCEADFEDCEDECKDDCTIGGGGGCDYDCTTACKECDSRPNAIKPWRTDRLLCFPSCENPDECTDYSWTSNMGICQDACVDYCTPDDPAIDSTCRDECDGGCEEEYDQCVEDDCGACCSTKCGGELCPGGGDLEVCQGACNDMGRPCDNESDACGDVCDDNVFSSEEFDYTNKVSRSDCKDACEEFSDSDVIDDCEDSCDARCTDVCQQMYFNGVNFVVYSVDCCPLSTCRGVCDYGEDKCVDDCEDGCDQDCQVDPGGGGGGDPEFKDQIINASRELQEMMEELSLLLYDLQKIWQEDTGKFSRFESRIATDYLNKIIKSIEKAQPVADYLSDLIITLRELENTRDDLDVNHPIFNLLDEVIDFIDIEVIDEIRQKIGFRYSCNRSKSGFLPRIACFEEDNGLALQDVVDDYLKTLYSLEQVSSWMPSIGEFIKLIEPKFRMDPIELRKDFFQQIERKFKGCVAGDEACDNQISAFASQRQDEKSYESFKQAVFDNPLAAIERYFDWITSSTDIINAHLANAKIGFSGINNTDQKQNYLNALDNIRDALRYLYWDLINGRPESKQLQESCDSLSPIFLNEPQDIEDGCRDLTDDCLQGVNGACEPTLNMVDDEQLVEDCKNLMEAEPHVLEDPEAVMDELRRLEEQRNCIRKEDCSEGPDQCVVCPTWLCDGVDDPLCQEVRDAGNVKIIDGVKLRYQNTALWDVSIFPTNAHKEWPPLSKCEEKKLLRETVNVSGINDHCRDTQQRMSDLKKIEVIIDNVGGIETIPAKIMECNTLAYEQAILDECRDFDNLKHAFKERECGDAVSEERCVEIRASLQSFCKDDIKQEEFQCKNLGLRGLFDRVKLPSVDFTASDSREARAARAQAKHICQTSFTNMRQPLNEIMKVLSILLGIRSYQGGKDGLAVLNKSAKALWEQADQIITMILEAPKQFGDLWDKEDEKLGLGWNNFSVNPVQCISYPMTSYGASGIAKTGSQGGPVCPEVENYFAGLEAQFSLIRQNLKMIDLSRKDVSKRLGDDEGFAFTILGYHEPNPALNEVVMPIYDWADELKNKAQLLWAISTAINFANKNCTCGQSYCPEIPVYKNDDESVSISIPLCMSGLPLTIEPIKEPYCSLVWLLRYPLNMMANKLEYDLANQF